MFEQTTQKWPTEQSEYDQQRTFTNKSKSNSFVQKSNQLQVSKCLSKVTLRVRSKPSYLASSKYSFSSQYTPKIGRGDRCLRSKSSLLTLVKHFIKYGCTAKTFLLFDKMSNNSSLLKKQNRANTNRLVSKYSYEVKIVELSEVRETYS